LQSVIVILFLFELQAHISLKKERDSSIHDLFATYSLGSLPNSPFSDEVALNLTSRVKSRLADLEKDLDDKKVVFSVLSLVYVSVCSLLGASQMRSGGIFKNDFLLLLGIWDKGSFSLVCVFT